MCRKHLLSLFTVEQTSLARLRLGNSNLIAHRARWPRFENVLVACGKVRETGLHFLLFCDLYEHRLELLSDIELLYEGRVTEEVLHRTGGVNVMGDETFFCSV